MEQKISINPFAEFSKATLAGKRRIIKQQKTPNSFLIPWYQLAKGAMRKYLADPNDTLPIFDGLEKLKKKKPEKKRQIIDVQVSIEALNKILEIKFPDFLSKYSYEVIKPKENYFIFCGIRIIISPEIIFKSEINGKVVYGAIKLHVCKRKPFDAIQGRYVAILIHYFLKKNVAKANEIVLPELCLSLDVFGERIIDASNSSQNEVKVIKMLCSEIKQLWVA